MIVPDWTIRNLGRRGLINPYHEGHVNPASLDLTLGHEFVYLDNGRRYTGDGIHLVPGTAPVLVTTAETIHMPNHLAGHLMLKSSMGRMGVQMCAAGWVDPGFRGNLSVTLYVLAPVKLMAGQRFVQLVYHQMHGTPERPYNGRYQHQNGPTMAREVQP